jgi:L-rhamnose mutarotase
MKITGHQSEQSFLRYIRITKEETAKRMAAHNSRKNWAILMGDIQHKQLMVAI